VINNLNNDYICYLQFLRNLCLRYIYILRKENQILCFLLTMYLKTIDINLIFNREINMYCANVGDVFREKTSIFSQIILFYFFKQYLRLNFIIFVYPLMLFIILDRRQSR